MRKLLIIILIMSCFQFFGCFGFSNICFLPVASVFTIILSDAVTGEPISGATVNVIGEPVPDTDNLFTETLTDSADGEYDFYHTGGSYTIEIQAEGYISQTVSTGYLEGCGGPEWKWMFN